MNKNRFTLKVLYLLLTLMIVPFLLSLVLVISTSTGTEAITIMDTVLELISMTTGGF